MDIETVRDLLLEEYRSTRRMLTIVSIINRILIYTMSVFIGLMMVSDTTIPRVGVAVVWSIYSTVSPSAYRSRLNTRVGDLLKELSRLPISCGENSAALREAVDRIQVSGLLLNVATNGTLRMHRSTPPPRERLEEIVIGP